MHSHLNVKFNVLHTMFKMFRLLLLLLLLLYPANLFMYIFMLVSKWALRL